MLISITAALTNSVLNYVLIMIMRDAMGAAIATVFTFFVSWVLNLHEGMKRGNVRIKWEKALLMYGVLALQTVAIIISKNIFIAGIGLFLIIALNWNNIMWAKDKWKYLIKRSV